VLSEDLVKKMQVFGRLEGVGVVRPVTQVHTGGTQLIKPLFVANTDQPPVVALKDHDGPRKKEPLDRS
jgi:hypothetical protein